MKSHRSIPHPIQLLLRLTLLAVATTLPVFGAEDRPASGTANLHLLELKSAGKARAGEKSTDATRGDEGSDTWLADASLGALDLARDVQARVVNLGWTGRRGTRLLVLPPPAAAPDVLTEAREDLMVMSRILSKAIRDDQGGSKDWFDMGLVVRPGAQPYDAMLLDGYGAVFFLNTAFPLVAPESKAADSTDATLERDTTWERTRRELAGDGPETDSGTDALALHERLQFLTPGWESYDADKVARLRESLINALRQGTNLRHLQARDWVTVVVSGPAPAPQGQSRQKKTRKPADEIGAGSLLTFRVSKGVLDDVAAGRLSADEFAKRVETAERLETLPPQARRF